MASMTLVVTILLALIQAITGSYEVLALTVFIFIISLMFFITSMGDVDNG